MYCSKSLRPELSSSENINKTATSTLCKQSGDVFELFDHGFSFKSKERRKEALENQNKTNHLAASSVLEE